MLYLILSVLFSTLIIVTFKVMGEQKINELQTIALNYFFAVLLGVIIWHEPLSLRTYTGTSWFWFSVMIGVTFIITFFLLSRSSRLAGVSITAVASRMSVILPVTAGFFMFNDSITALKIAGIILSIFSFFLIFRTKGKIKIKWQSVLLPVLLLLGIGINDTLMKYIQHNYLTDDLTLFLTVVFFTAFIIGAIIALYRIITLKERFNPRSIFTGFLLGSFNFGSTYFFIRSMSIFQSSVLFPVVNVSIVVLTALVGLFFFRERLTRINWIGILVAVIAIMLISMN